MEKYKFHYDAGHGWLEVDLQELKDLGIEKEISGYSYQKGNKVYLEEDCDMDIFMYASKISNDQIIEVDDGDDSFIRECERYGGGK